MIPTLCSNGHCVNTPGSFFCDCPRGYRYDETMHTCSGEGNSLLLPITLEVIRDLMTFWIISFDQRKYIRNVPSIYGRNTSTLESAVCPLMSQILGHLQAQWLPRLCPFYEEEESLVLFNMHRRTQILFIWWNNSFILGFLPFPRLGGEVCKFADRMPINCVKASMLQIN